MTRWPLLTAFIRYASMIRSVKPAYFYGVACDLHPVRLIQPGMPLNLRQQILYLAIEAVRGFTSQEECAAFLPRSVERGKLLLSSLEYWLSNPELCKDSDLPGLHQRVSHFESVL